VGPLISADNERWTLMMPLDPLFRSINHHDAPHDDITVGVSQAWTTNSVRDGNLCMDAREIN
jgi:hypothetical protein